MTKPCHLAIIDQAADRQQRLEMLLSDPAITFERFTDTRNLGKHIAGSDAILADDDFLDGILARGSLFGSTKPLIGYSSEPCPQRVAETVRNGVDDYLGWPFTLDDLKLAIARARKRKEGQERPEKKRKALKAIQALTEREREILSLLANGLTNNEIGVRLDISDRTAEAHRLNVHRKLGVRNAVEAARIAFIAGLID